MLTTLKTLFLLGLIALVAAGCSDGPLAPELPPGDEIDIGDGGDEENEEEETGEEVLTGTGDFVVEVAVRNLRAGTPPKVNNAVGDLDITLDPEQVNEISGLGSCILDASSVSYVLVADLVDPEDVRGIITFTISSREQVVPWSGQLVDGVLEGTFTSTTSFTTAIAIDWDGSFSVVLR